MKLLRVKIISAPTCGGLLDGLDVYFDQTNSDNLPPKFSPTCLIGPNGSGKSQFLQVIAEIFQSVFHTYLPAEERIESNPELLFEVEYLIKDTLDNKYRHIKLTRKAKGKQKINIQEKLESGWSDLPDNMELIKSLLPTKVIGYTSGANETLSFPFLVSRAGYAEEVGKNALSDILQEQSIPDTKLMLIDYGTNLEVLVANLLLGTTEQITNLLEASDLKDIYSFRCIIQLAHSAVPKIPKRGSINSNRKGIQLTSELEEYIKFMKSCSTCYHYEEKDERYIFDVLVNDEVRKAFRYYWNTPLNLYSSFHKLSMLNDLAISRKTRNRFKRETKTRRFASRLPEPQDEDKVFRFERVEFLGSKDNSIVDYVSLSDGEHQLAQVLGTMGMISTPNVLFLLDEAESHFNPQWRVQFISKLYNTPTEIGPRDGFSQPACMQECLITTHAPFVPSDMDRKKVMIFNKTEKGIEVNLPQIQTYGSTFDDILGDCFEVKPPISALSQSEVEKLGKSNDPQVIRNKIDELGFSVEKLLLVDHLRQLEKKEK